MNWYRRFPTFYYFLKSVFKASPRLRHHATLRDQLQSITRDDELYLIGTNTGGNDALLSFDLLLGIGLRARGKKVKFVLCDGALPACQMCEHSNFHEAQFPIKGLNENFCRNCFLPALKLIEQLGFEVLKLSEFYSTKLGTPTRNSGTEQHGRAGFLRYEARGDFENLLNTKKSIYKHFENASQITQAAYREILKSERPACVILHHGIYVPQGSALQAVIESKTRIVTWCTSYRKSSVMLAHGDSYHKTMPAETNRVVKGVQLNENKKKLILSYLQSRNEGNNDWISFSKKSKNNSGIKTALGIPSGADTYALFTNVIWDANLHFETDLFVDMIDWLLKTIDFFSSMPQKHLIVRVHPAEVLGTIKSKQMAAEEISKSFEQLPINVHLIEPTNSDLDTYSVIEECDVALVYGTKAAIEIAALGKTVVVCGSAWVRGKGFTIDPQTVNEYKKILSTPCNQLQMSTSAKLNALRYAFYIFFERMITISNLKKPKFFAPFTINQNIKSIQSITDDKGLQRALDEIVSGRPRKTQEL